MGGDGKNIVVKLIRVHLSESSQILSTDIRVLLTLVEVNATLVVRKKKKLQSETTYSRAIMLSHARRHLTTKSIKLLFIRNRCFFFLNRLITKSLYIITLRVHICVIIKEDRM